MPAQAGVVGLLLLLLCAGAARAQIQPYHADPVPPPAVVAAMKAQAAKAALAAPTLPDYQTCTLSWNLVALNIYDLPGPADQATLQKMVPSAVVTFSAPIVPTWVCPPEARTHYVYSALVDGGGRLQTAGLPSVFTVKGGSPPLVFAIGAKVQVMNTTLLNVRPVPSMSSCKPCPTQPKGAAAVIIGGPVVTTDPVNGTVRWWQLDYATGADGWSSEAFLAVVL